MTENELLAYIREYFEYSEENAGFLYKKPTAIQYRNKVGCRAGSLHPVYGYTSIKIRGKLIREHKLVWLLHKGMFPVGELDHINNNESDNRISNLREATRSQNCANRKTWNKLGYKGVGVCKRGKPYQAGIKHNNKTRYLGAFDTIDEAARAYDRAARQIHGEFASLNFPDEQ